MSSSSSSSPPLTDDSEDPEPFFSSHDESLAQSLKDPNKAVGKTAEQVERLVEDEAEALMLRSLPVFQDAEDWEQCSLTANNLSNLYANQKRKKRGKGDAEADRHF